MCPQLVHQILSALCATLFRIADFARVGEHSLDLFV